MRRVWLITGVLVVLALCSCGKDRSAKRSGVVNLEVWFHSGQESERATIQDQVARFNATHDSIQIHLTSIPEGSYNAQVQAAALADDLPDVLEFDGPFLYNYVWQGHLIPLDTLLSPVVKNDLLPSIIDQGTYRGQLYSVGTFDSGLGLFVRRSRLDAIATRIPAGPADAWSADEFEELMSALASRDDDGAVLDMKLNYPGEWYTYAFSPILQSASGDLIDRDTYLSADGVLNGPESVAAMERVQNWLEKGLVDPNVDDAAFVNGRVAISWTGHWQYRRYEEAFGQDLVVVPLPDFSQGTRTGQGSWNWGITNKCSHPRQAARFLTFLLQPDEVLAMASANGAVPATYAAIARSTLYREDGPLNLFVDQIVQGYSVPRPETPAYPVITAAFQDAFLDIVNGVDVQEVLDRAAAVIDQDIQDNLGYPSVSQ